MNKSRNNHWCEICKAPKKSESHKHCEKCLTPSEKDLGTPDACNRWGCNEIYYYVCKTCGYTTKEVIF